MKRFAPLVTLAAAALCLLAQQPSRDAYRSAYRVWRQAEPNLEIDAATAGPNLSPRTSHAAAEEVAYSLARSEFLGRLASEHEQQIKWLQAPVLPAGPGPSPAKELSAVVMAEIASVTSNIGAFAGDTDPGLQQLRQALLREQAALGALDTAITTRQTAELKATQATAAMESAREKALGAYKSGIDALNAAADSVSKEGMLWAEYYRKLAEAARGGPPAPLLSSVVAPTAPPAPANPAPPPRAPSITPLPLARYTGGWTYSDTIGQYHGKAPEFVDLVVHSENGKMNGTFYGRFKLPAGSTDDPLIRFDFEGDLQPTTTQTFKLTTSDNVSGSVDLIPGTAFNLLEVNFSTDPKPGKITQGDLLLVKK